MRKSDLLFFSTGAAALVYESVWIRLLSRLVGSDAGGLAVVLAVFMGGMGLGAHLCGGRARRAGRPARWFAGLELGLALWAAASPLALQLVSPVGSAGGRAMLAALFLLPPTLAMGATFPLMGRLVVREEEDAAREVSAFYGANTLGAAAGALLGPMLLMPGLGLSGALYAAAVLDVLAALGALRWLADAPPARATRSEPAPLLSPVLVATFLMGFAGLGLEVLLARLVVSVTGASVYAYAIVLCVFLLGIGLGSRQLAGPERSGALRAERRTLAGAALFLPAATLVGLVLLRGQLGEADLFTGLSNRSPAGLGVLGLWALHALFAGLALLPPALLCGAALPSAIAACSADAPRAAREDVLARVYAFNTAGALAGSLVAGFVLLPALGPRGALFTFLGAAWLAGFTARGLGPRAWAGSLALFALLGAFLARPGASSPEVQRLYLAHDAQATVAVEERPDGDARVRSLRVNGKVVATTAAVDVRLQRLLAHIPGQVHGAVEEALVIGLGTGMTAGALLDLPGLARLDVFEISASMPGGARQFAAWNGGVVDDPRTHLRIVDGRHALSTSAARWDLITSDPIHPWTRGSSDLYSLEHFEAMAAHLAPGGVASQWLPLYQLSEEDVRTVLATWTAAFADTAAFLTAYDLALLGANEPLELTRLAQEPPVAVSLSLAEVGLRLPGELLVLEVGRHADLLAFAAGTPPMRDDDPVLEFRAPYSYLGGYSVEALRWSARADYVTRFPAELRPRALQVRALLEAFLEALPSGMQQAAREYGEALMRL